MLNGSSASWEAESSESGLTTIPGADVREDDPGGCINVLEPSQQEARRVRCPEAHQPATIVRDASPYPVAALAGSYPCSPGNGSWVAPKPQDLRRSTAVVADRVRDLAG